MEDFQRLGWVKLHRKLLDHPRFSDGDWLKVSTACILLATHKPHRVIFEGKERTLLPGQFIASRKSLSKLTGVQESKVERILTTLKTEQQIEQLSTPRNRLITVKNWEKYQVGEQLVEQQVNNNRTTSEHKQELKELKEDLNTPRNHSEGRPEEGPEPPDLITPIIAYLNEKSGKAFRRGAESTRTIIAARLKDGFTPEDCRRVIDIKAAEWMGTDFEKFLRPETLFGKKKFEGYTQERPRTGAQAKRNGAHSPEAIQASQAALLTLAQGGPHGAG